MRTRRALVCAPKMPEYDREGGSRRVFHLIEFLRGEGWAVSFVAENATGGDRYARALQQMGVATYASRDPWSVGRACLIDPRVLLSTGHYDMLLAAFWDHAEQYLPLVRSAAPRTKFVIDSIDLHFLRNARSAFCDRQGEAGRPGKLGPRYADEVVRELNVYAAADAVLTVSRKEADLVNDFTAGAARAYAVPDTEDLPASAVPFDGRRGVLFVGNFRHPPNVQAVEHLCRDVLPRLDSRLLAEHPVYVVGNGITKEIVGYAAGLANVSMVGWVPSIVPYLQRARISVVPLLYGAGTKRKLMQSLMTGTPAVSTGVGVEGLGLLDGAHVLVAGGAAAFADSMRRLLTDEALWQKLSLEGQRHARAAHGREAVGARFREVLAEIMGEPLPRAQTTPAARAGV